MTAFNQLCNGRQSKRGNIKDRQPGQRKRQNLDLFSPQAQAEREAARWSKEGFMAQGPGQWLYTWQGVGFPIIKVVKGIRLIGGKIVSGFFAEVIGSEIAEFFSHNSHPSNIKPRLDDIIFELMLLQADVDTPLVEEGVFWPT